MDPAAARIFVTLAWAALILYWWIASFAASEAVEHERGVAPLVHLALFGGAFALALWPPLDLGVPTPVAPRTGLTVATSGIAFAIWARGALGQNWSGTITVKEEHELVTRGPYAIVRHPIYTGLLLGFLGTALVVGDLRGWIAFALACAAVAIKVPREEAFMARTFPDEWPDYRARTRMIVPWLL